MYKGQAVEGEKVTGTRCTKRKTHKAQYTQGAKCATYRMHRKARTHPRKKCQTQGSQSAENGGWVFNARIAPVRGDLAKNDDLM